MAGRSSLMDMFRTGPTAASGVPASSSAVAESVPAASNWGLPSYMGMTAAADVLPPVPNGLGPTSAPASATNAAAVAPVAAAEPAGKPWLRRNWLAVVGGLLAVGVMCYILSKMASVRRSGKQVNAQEKPTGSKSALPRRKTPRSHLPKAAVRTTAADSDSDSESESKLEPDREHENDVMQELRMRQEQQELQAMQAEQAALRQQLQQAQLQAQAQQQAAQQAQVPAPGPGPRLQPVYVTPMRPESVSSSNRPDYESLRGRDMGMPRRGGDVTQFAPPPSQLPSAPPPQQQQQQQQQQAMQQPQRSATPNPIAMPMQASMDPAVAAEAMIDVDNDPNFTPM